MRSLSLIVVALVGLCSIPTTTFVHGFSSQVSSSFLGHTRPFAVASPSTRVNIQNGSTMQMKQKGKASNNVPIQMRGQYKKQQEMAQMRDQMAAASTVGPDGLPVFQLFVRAKKNQTATGVCEQVGATLCLGFFCIVPDLTVFSHSPTMIVQIWYPCGSFKGDERSAALAKSYAESGWLADISKKQLDAGIAGSLAQDVNRLVETISRAYPALRSASSSSSTSTSTSSSMLEFGYRLKFPGLPEDKAKEIFPVEPKEQGKGPLEGLRNIFS